MIELDFWFRRIPREFRPLARQRGLSTTRWVLAAVAAWIGTEIVAVSLLVSVYVFLLPWVIDPALVGVIAWVAGIWAAIRAAETVRNHLEAKPTTSAAYSATPLPEPTPVGPRSVDPKTVQALVAWALLGAVLLLALIILGAR